MALLTTIFIVLLGVLALFSIIEAGVATKSAQFLFQGGRTFNDDFQTFRNGAALLAFDGFVTFFLATGLLVWYVMGRTVAPLIILPTVIILFILWLAGAAAFSHGYDTFLADAICNLSICSTIKAAVAFGWLGWITLIALLVLAVLFLRKPQTHDESAAATGKSGRSGFSMAGLRKKNQTSDVEKASVPQDQTSSVNPAPVPAASQPSHNTPAMPVAGTGHNAGAENVGTGYHGQPPAEQPFSGAYGAPVPPTHEGQNPAYDPAQAYAQQSQYEGQKPAADPTVMPQAPAQPAQNQAPAGWSVSPLGNQPAQGSAPAAEIVPGKSDI
ncbi:hypothetical protein CF319_g3723 [Tilletia indica]|nr:hypothetical protein CF319_g3723 [Tilletia indica]